ncbi:MAG: DUF3575 domain-containing protein [Bacteroidota bacterium]|nr:DUF3575 domain-containing protein [Bacteroidota bacterium]
MKKYIVFFIFLSCLIFNGYSQLPKNAFKVNLSGLVIRNISIQYERQVSPKTSLALAFRDVPYGKLPFEQTIADNANDPFVQFDKINVGSFGFTPEFRFYLGKKSGMRGFYLGPFVSYNNYKTDLPINYNNKTGIFNGNLKTITGGLQIGSQFRLSNHFFIDWWIIGPNYGGASGNLNFTGTLDPNEQSILKTELDKLQADAPFHFIQSSSVNSSGAVIIAKGPWGGLRGLGINLSYHF